MQESQSLTFWQARRLLELAIAAKKPCMVKVVDKNIRAKPGRAFLIDIISKNRVTIKPLHHQKTEIVDVENLRLWKSGCDFDISEVNNMNTTLPSINNPSFQVEESKKYVVVSKNMKQIWGGDKGWSSNVHHASIYSNENDAQKSAAKRRNSPLCEDSEVILKSELPLFVSNYVLSKDPVENVSTRQEVSATEIKSMEKSSMIVNASMKEVIDDDSDELLNAVNQRKMAFKEISEYRKLLDEAINRFNESNRRIIAITSVSPTVSTKESSSRPVVPRGELRSKIIEVLKESSALDLKTLINKVLGRLPQSTESSVSQCIYKLRSEEKVVKDAKNNWSLTAAGRQI
jgi:hypothetical protein